MEKIKTIFRSRPKLMIGLVIILALSLPFVVNQVLKQQDVRQRADSAPAITFNFMDPIRTVKVGDTVTVGLLLNASTNDIGALHFKLNYSSGFAGNVTTSIAGPLTSVQQNNPQDGPLEVTLVNLTANKITGSNQNVMKFEFKALKVGEMKITMNEIQATASLQNQYVPVENPGNIIAKITVVDANTQLSPTPQTTPITSNAPSPTQTVATSPTPTNTPTPSPTPTTAPTPLPTATPIPIPTIGSDQTGLQVSLALPAIGIKANLGENNAPHRRTRIATAVVLDSSDIAVTTEKTGVLTYNTATGRYDGYISLGSSIATASGSYNVKIKMDNTLYKRAPGIVAINKLTPNNSVLPFELVPGDITGPQITANNTIELLDYNLLSACYRGQAACTSSVAIIADFNDDGILIGDDVDSNIMSRGFYIQNGD